MRWACSFICLLVGLSVGTVIAARPAIQAAPERTWHMIVIPAEADGSAIQNWLARRGVDARVAEVVLAAKLSEADVEAVAEREDVIVVRAPRPGEPVVRGWVPVARSGE